MSGTPYPVTTPYGYVKDYPLNNGFHRGVDYGYPMYTPIVVCDVSIGISGNTGYVTGPHCHVGKWVNGSPVDPGSGGFDLKQPVTVYDTGEDAENGKYVRLTDGDGILWVYLHMSNNSLVIKGQKIGEEMKPATDEDIGRVYLACLRRAPSAQEIKDNRGVLLHDLLKGVIESDEHLNLASQIDNALAGSPKATKLAPGIYQVGV